MRLLRPKHNVNCQQKNSNRIVKQKRWRTELKLKFDIDIRDENRKRYDSEYEGRRFLRFSEKSVVDCVVDVGSLPCSPGNHTRASIGKFPVTTGRSPRNLQTIQDRKFEPVRLQPQILTVVVSFAYRIPTSLHIHTSLGLNIFEREIER